MASTNRPLDESTATLVAPDDHLHTKDLLSTPTNTSTAISSGTVSDEEPSTPEPLAGVPVSVLCGWPHAGSPYGKAGLEGTTESGWPHEDDPKDPTAKDPKGRPDDGSGGWPYPGDSDKPDPAKWHTLKGTSNDGTDSTSKDDSVSVLCGWPHADGPNGKTGREVASESGWPSEDGPKDPTAKYPKGRPDNGSGFWPRPGDSDSPDPAKWHTLKGTSNDGTDSTSKDDSVSVRCGWPHADGPNGKPGREVTKESGWPHEDDPNEAAAKYSEGRPPVGGVPDNGSGAWPNPGDSSKDDPAKGWPNGNSDKPDPAKWHTLKGTRNDGTDSTSHDDDSVSVLCGWPHVNGPEDSAAKIPKGRPLVGGVPDNGSDLVPEPGDSSKPDPANFGPNGNASKPDPAKRGRQGQRGNGGNGETGTDFTSEKKESGWPPGNGDMPNPGDPSKNDPAKIQPDSGNDQTQPETAAPERRRKPGTVGPEGQPPWGVKNLAATTAATAANATSLQGPEGQPPWGIKNLGAAVNAAGGVAGPEGQPPWGIKSLGAAVNAKADVAGPEGQPPWGVKNLAASDGGPEGQPPWGTKGRAAATTTTTGGNESGKGNDGAQDASA